MSRKEKLVRTSISNTTIYPNWPLIKLKTPETIEAQVVSADAVNMSCSLARRRG
jgi:hypothetical protein